MQEGLHLTLEFFLIMRMCDDSGFFELEPVPDACGEEAHPFILMALLNRLGRHGRELAPDARVPGAIGPLQFRERHAPRNLSYILTEVPTRLSSGPPEPHPVP